MVLGEIIFASSLVVKIVPDTNSMLQFPLATAVNTFQCFMRFQQQSCISHILGVTNILDIHDNTSFPGSLQLGSQTFQ